ncbi:hypothetical protein NERG_01381 [Nematocida ausubeli]|uniref:Uncharacterized protein n=1 Tax=Nematocida ausubeli (strain ATCC PRA-371 / ERTm2) TaxID=1913371 RepID=H8ZCD8_NEMA1|nr:hypothetical protein NERG_01381 [Nematocida ausubeli]
MLGLEESIIAANIEEVAVNSTVEIANHNDLLIVQDVNINENIIDSLHVAVEEAPALPEYEISEQVTNFLEKMQITGSQILASEYTSVDGLIEKLQCVLVDRKFLLTKDAFNSATEYLEEYKEFIDSFEMSIKQEGPEVISEIIIRLKEGAHALSELNEESILRIFSSVSVADVESHINVCELVDNIVSHEKDILSRIGSMGMKVANCIPNFADEIVGAAVNAINQNIVE